MDGIVANLKGVWGLAKKYATMVMIDDSYAVGFFGKNRLGTLERCDV